MYLKQMYLKRSYLKKMYLKHPTGSFRQKGVGLPATIFLIVIIAMIVLALSDLNQKSNLGFAQDFYATKAFYAAESGAQVALNRVFVGGQACSNALADIDFDHAGANAGLESCLAVLACREDVVADVSYYTFSSTATCGHGFEQAQRQVEVRARSE